MTKEAFNISKDFMEYHGFERYPKLLHTMDFKKLHEKVCAIKGVKREIGVSDPYIKTTLWSLFLNSIVEPKSKKFLVSTISIVDIATETGISKRQLYDIFSTLIFMDLIEVNGINYDSSKRYRLLFTEWTNDKIKTILE